MSLRFPRAGNQSDFSTSRIWLPTALQLTTLLLFPTRLHRLSQVRSLFQCIHHHREDITLKRLGYFGEWDCLDCRWRIPSIPSSLAWTTRVRLHLVTGQGDHAAPPRFAWRLSPSSFTGGESFKAGESWWGSYKDLEDMFAGNARLESKPMADLFICFRLCFICFEFYL